MNRKEVVEYIKKNAKNRITIMTEDVNNAFFKTLMHMFKGYKGYTFNDTKYMILMKDFIKKRTEMERNFSLKAGHIEYLDFMKYEVWEKPDKVTMTIEEKEFIKYL